MKLFQPRRVDDELHGITFGEFVEATPADAVEAFGKALLAEFSTYDKLVEALTEARHTDPTTCDAFYDECHCPGPRPGRVWREWVTEGLHASTLQHAAGVLLAALALLDAAEDA